MRCMGRIVGHVPGCSHSTQRLNMSLVFPEPKVRGSKVPWRGTAGHASRVGHCFQPKICSFGRVPRVLVVGAALIPTLRKRPGSVGISAARTTKTRGTRLFSVGAAGGRLRQLLRADGVFRKRMLIYSVLRNAGWWAHLPKKQTKNEDLAYLLLAAAGCLQRPGFENDHFLDLVRSPPPNQGRPHWYPCGCHHYTYTHTSHGVGAAWELWRKKSVIFFEK